VFDLNELFYLFEELVLFGGNYLKAYAMNVIETTFFI